MHMKQLTNKFVKTKWIAIMSLRVFIGLFLFTALVSGRPNDKAVMLRGTVVDQNGVGIEGVVVNNGREFCSTDKRGTWKLPTDTTVSKFIAISTPREYVLPQHNGLAAGYYIPVGEAMTHRTANKFTLERRDSISNRFHYIVVSDPQILNAHDMKRWRNETVDDIMHTASRLRKTGDVIGMSLGDVVFDNMALYPQYVNSIKSRRMTFFQCIGNHDFDKRHADPLSVSEPIIRKFLTSDTVQGSFLC